MQTINLTNSQALRLLTMVEQTVHKMESENETENYYYDEIKDLEQVIHKSCPELVSRWHNLQALIKSGEDGAKFFRRACDEFDEWINLNE